MGALDGFLFALVGSLVGFAFFAILFALGTCGGGDVKLFTAIGAWLGRQRLLGSRCLDRAGGWIRPCGCVLRLFGDPRKILRMKPVRPKERRDHCELFSSCLVGLFGGLWLDVSLRTSPCQTECQSTIVEVSNAKKS